MYTLKENEHKRLTNAQFKNLERTSDDDIIELSMIFFRLTDNQTEKLSNDDYSRNQDYQEGLRCLMAEGA